MVFLHVNHWCQWFSNGFWSDNHWYQWFFNGFVVRQPLDTLVFQWFPMAANHWSDDGMVTIHRSGLDPGISGPIYGSSCLKLTMQVIWLKLN